MKTRKASLLHLPYGRAQRRGVPRLQTKLDRNCLYKTLIFQRKRETQDSLFRQMGQLKDRGCLDCKRNSIKTAFIKTLIFQRSMHMIAKLQRARVGNLSFFFVKRAGGPTLTRAGRARARARAKYKPKHRKLDFFVG